MQPVATPFRHKGLTVRPEWIDWNRHMNVANYVEAFDIALRSHYPELGLDPDLLHRERSSTFAVEMHLTYQRELTLGDPLEVTTQLLDYGLKRCHYFQHMYHATESYLAATAEWMVLYVDMDRRKAAEIPAIIRNQLEKVRLAHARLPRPVEAGRAVGTKPAPRAG